MEKIEKLYDEMLDINSKLIDECTNYIKDAVTKTDDGIIILEDDNVAVPYYGGNHPEYASDCFNMVHSVYLDNEGELKLNTEDDDEYDIDDLNGENLYYIALAISKK